MKIGIFGDLHYTLAKPRNRTDEDYEATWRGKFLWACENPLKDCKYVIFPGDVFDNFRASDFVKQYFLPLLKQTGKHFLAIYGQHDLRFHNSNKLNTPLRVIEASGILSVLGPEPFYPGVDVDIYGANWEEEIPEIQEPKNVNILVIHKMIIKDDKLWEAQTGYSMARVLLRKHPYDLIVSGDNHQGFTDSYERRHLVNLGSLMRSTIDQLDHKPSVAAYDTKTKELEIFEIPVKPASEVLKIEEAKKEKEERKHLEELKQKLEESYTMEKIKGLDFKKNAADWMQQNKKDTEQGVLDIIQEAMQDL